MTVALRIFGGLCLAGLVIGVLLVVWVEMRSIYFYDYGTTPRCLICDWPCSASELICARCTEKNEEQTI